jgi:hypothetical protein
MALPSQLSFGGDPIIDLRSGLALSCFVNVENLFAELALLLT